MEVLIKGSNRHIWSKSYSRKVKIEDIEEMVLKNEDFVIYQKGRTKSVTNKNVTLEVLKKVLANAENVTEAKLRAAIKALAH